MSAVLETSVKLMTAEEFLRLPENGQHRELVEGVVVTMNMPGFRHGEVCAAIVRLLGSFVTAHSLGRVICNDSGVITRRGPDTVRGADVAYYSYGRLPKGQRPSGYPGVSPEVVFEVVSPFNDRMKIALKTGEYLNVNVKVVCVVDPQFETVNLHYPDKPTATLQASDELAFDELPGFRLPVSQLFE